MTLTKIKPLNSDYNNLLNFLKNLPEKLDYTAEYLKTGGIVFETQKYRALKTRSERNHNTLLDECYNILSRTPSSKLNADFLDLGYSLKRFSTILNTVQRLWQRIKRNFSKEDLKLLLRFINLILYILLAIYSFESIAGYLENLKDWKEFLESLL